MKKDFQKAAGILSKVALVLAGLSVAQASFANQAQGLQAEVPAHGRATLTVEDLQTLLGLKTRDPSSQAQMQAQDVLASAPIFQVEMSAAQKAKIAKELAALKMKRVALAKTLEKEKVAQVNELRTQRRNIQISRTRDGKDDPSLARNLFSSLLAEANAEAGVESALIDFDHKNAVEVQYSVSSEGSRSISAIKLGAKTLWAGVDLSTSAIASR